MKLLPMSTDSRGSWPLPGAPPPTPPAAPGESVSIKVTLQEGPLAFTGLHVGPDNRFRVVGPGGINPAHDASMAGVWRVDEVTIDGLAVESVVAALGETARKNASQLVAGDSLVVHGDFGVGSSVAMRATNVGDAPAYFYATWELEDVH